MKLHARCVAALALIAVTTLPLFAQTNPPPEQPPHDITGVDAVPSSGAISTPLPQRQRRRLKRYDMPELVGARQAIGSQLIGGELPRPLLDYAVRTSILDQRISFFDGSLVVIRVAGAGGTIQKRVIIPEDSLKNYLEAASIEELRLIRASDLSEPNGDRRAFLRIYDEDGSFVERAFDPAGIRPKSLHSLITPLEDLLRILSEDRTVTSTVANYEPKVGDELVADDRKVWRVQRLVKGTDIVELRCTSVPLIMYVGKQDLYNYFVGRPAED